MSFIKQQYGRIFHETGVDYSKSGILEEIADKYANSDRIKEAINNATDAIIMVEKRGKDTKKG